MESQISGEARGAGSRIGGVFSKTFLAATAAIGGAVVIGHFLKGAVAEAREAQKVGALTNSVIKATGGAANVTAKQVGNLATSISLKTGIDDEVIQSGQNMLLTFKNIRNEAGKGNDIFNQTSKTLVDMAAAMGSDPKNAAIQLGKALNDPVKGVSALSRVGVTFTEGQKAQIASMVESGNVMGAQKIVLKELNSEFGGAAAAQATAGEKAAVAVGNLKEQIGTALLPIIDKVENAFVKATPAISAAIAGIGPAFSKIGAFFAPIIAQVQGFFSGGGGGGILAGIQSFAATIQANFLPVLQTMANTFQTVILPAVTSLVTYVGSAMLPIFTKVGSILRDQVVPIVASFASFLYGSLYPAVVQIVTVVGSKLKPVFDQYVATLKTQILPAVQSLLAKFREHQPAIQAAVLAVTKIIGKVVEFAAAVLAKVLPVVIKFQGFMAGQFIRGIGTAIGVLVQIVKAVIKVGDQFITGAQQIADFTKKVGTQIGKALKFISDLPSKAKAKIGDLGSLLFDAGKALIQGLIDGIMSKWNDLKSTLSKVTDVIPDWKGPAEKDAVLLRPAGQLVMKGLVDGIDDGLTPLQKKLEDVTKHIRDHLEKMRDKLKSSIDALKSDFASIASGVASAFSGDMFSATTGASFFDNLLHQQGTLKKLSAAFKKLLKWGLDPKFLSQLFQSGNSALILDLAGGNKTQALVDSQIFGANQSLANQLGGSVAQADLGPELRRQTHRLDQIEDHLKHLPKNIGKEINGAATAGHKGRAA